MGQIHQNTFHIQNEGFPLFSTIQEYIHQKAGLVLNYKKIEDTKRPYLQIFEVSHPLLSDYVNFYYEKNEIGIRKGGLQSYIWAIIATSLVDLMVEKYPNQCLLFLNWNCLVINESNKNIAYRYVVINEKGSNWMYKPYQKACKYKKFIH